jgi:hypothetical protein
MGDKLYRAVTHRSRFRKTEWWVTARDSVLPTCEIVGALYKTKGSGKKYLPTSLALPFDRLRERSMGKLFLAASLNISSYDKIEGSSNGLPT